MNSHFANWRKKQARALRQLKQGCHPKEIVVTISEDLLAHYTGKPLMDKYDVYQHLMDYWAETMQDDCYLIAADSWKAETYRVIQKDKKGRERDTGWACDLVPKPLIVARYFPKEQEAVVELQSKLESIAARITELEEEHSGEDGAFAEARKDAPEGKVTRSTVTARLDQIKGDKEFQDEAAVLKQWLKLSDQEADLKKRLKKAEDELDTLAYEKYPKLTEDEIKTLVVDNKWLAVLDAAIHGEMDRISQLLTRRLKELGERYETPLPQMVNRVAELETKVNCHLKRMGFSWN